VAWSVGHLAVIGVWLAGRWVVPHTPPTVLAAAYAGFAALLVGLGGALLLAQRPMGRVLISWGVILLVLLMFYAVIISFLLPSLEDVPAYLRRQGRIVGIVGVIHLLVDMVLGGLGQRVGRPAGWKAEKPAEQYMATEAMPGWDNPDRNR